MKKPERTPQRTAEEIKKVLGHCADTGMACHRCSYENRCLMVVRGKPIMRDALALVRQLEVDNAEKDKRIAELEQELAAVKRERDAAVRDCSEFPCNTCGDKENQDLCCNCIKPGSTRRANHVWRGVCPDTEVQTNE